MNNVVTGIVVVIHACGTSPHVVRMGCEHTLGLTMVLGCLQLV
jgi:hypothetical protein